MEFIKNELIDETLARYYKTFKCTLDTGDFVPAKYNKKIYKFIFKNLKKKFREVDSEYKKLKNEHLKTLIEEALKKTASDLTNSKSSTSEARPPC